MNVPVGVLGVSVYLPPRKSVSDLVEIGQLTSKKFNKIGVQSVPVAETEIGSDLAINASRDLLNKTKVDPLDIDILIYVGSAMNDYQVWLPSARVCDELNLKNAFAFDLNMGCGSYQTAIKFVAETLKNSGKWKTALLVSGDNFGHLTTNRETNEVILGDAGAAMLLQKGHERNMFFGYDAITKGYYHDLTFYTGFTPAAKKFVDSNSNVKENLWTFARGEKLQDLMKENISNYLNIAKNVLDEQGLALSDISYVIVPSGRLDLMEKIVKELGFPIEKTNIPFLADIGDCAASGFVIDIQNILEHYQPKAGEFTLCIGAGLGISWVASIIKH
ncbi:3-oxoacyl-ACP synthase III family protein [Viridibacillus sp. NPDC096237]|uniref:3-oxoacyl-ACP synthase III family protein n=1 Tax=Viridibacillus sp. NPDC096237 TaxID=3390721 RepID=UPI003D019C51